MTRDLLKLVHQSGGGPFQQAGAQCSFEMAIAVKGEQTERRWSKLKEWL
jgi:hypothetical protein